MLDFTLLANALTVRAIAERELDRFPDRTDDMGMHWRTALAFCNAVIARHIPLILASGQD